MNKVQGIDRIVEVACLLEELAGEVVFTGGSAVSLLLTDQAVSKIRPTYDVDVIVEIGTRYDYYAFQEKLRTKGFHEAIDEDVICRWKQGSIYLDIMPTNPEILGFTNRWYLGAVRNDQALIVNGTRLRAITAPYFLATKIEAFHGRGGGDYLSSQDIEDVVAVLDGRAEVVADVIGAPVDVRNYLAIEFSLLLDNEEFLEALPGHLAGDAASQKRIPLLIDRIEQIVSAST